MTTNFWEIPSFKDQWEEISGIAFHNDSTSDLLCFDEWKQGRFIKARFFKRKESWPKVFSGCSFDVEVYRDGLISLREHGSGDTIYAGSRESQQALQSALTLAQQIQGGKK